MTNPTTKDLLAILRANPHQDLISVWTVDYKSWLIITTQSIVLYCDGNKWWWYYRDGHNPSIKDMVNPTQFKSLDPKDVHAEIDRVLNIAKQTHTETQTMTTDPTHVSIDRYRELEAELKTVTKDRDTYKARQEYTQEILNQIWDVTGWPEKFDEPDAIEYIKRLKSKADRAGLLSVVCRRLCGDENASIETVHKALNLFDDQRNALDYIGEKVGCYPDPFNPNQLSEIQSNVAQLVKSLGEKTVEVDKLQEGLKIREAQLRGYAANKRLQEFAHIQTILNNAEVATVYDYETDRSVPTDERVRILCERLKENTANRLDDGAKMHKLNDEIRQAHRTLNDLNAARCMGTIDLSLSARIRSVFQTHTKV